ncbi:sigma-70 family RNA polymerase sigma factor [Brevibacillus sp. SYP-B805]|uniref:RNA polymerase sigma factor n=1 Tax=Brevibacillus sp. SYP-B805 TaxID=1578199 RepID=UPI0013E9A4E1|nr:sigma-70 family RNA polymerase sigma factor [Brevibacillus sp. SYP-B805]NGQ97054.1 sigma-70 family RNA polymerase sigma factor [Brevibacillus sp. SYP-B805]
MNAVRTYDQIYREYAAKIMNYFRNRMGNAWDVEDLTTTVFVKAFSKLEQYNGAYPFGAWLYAIARNTLVDYLRKQREIPAETERLLSFAVQEGECPETRLMRKEEHGTVWRHVKNLTPDQYRVIVLRYLSDMSMLEIAAEMGKSEAAVKIIHFRAIQVLRQRMKKQAGRNGLPSGCR